MNLQSLSTTYASNSAWMKNSVRDRIENYISSSMGGDTTEYGKMVSGFADQMNDPLVVRMIDAHVNKTEDSDSLWKEANWDQRRSFGAFMDMNYLQQRKQNSDKLNKQFVEIVDGNTNAIDVHRHAIIRETLKAYNSEKSATSNGRGEFAEAQWAAAMNLGVDHLKTVDREAKAGVSPVTWENRFRSVVEGLDRAYRQMLGTAPGGSPAAADITRQYEAKLTELFDYAKARTNSAA